MKNKKLMIMVSAVLAAVIIFKGLFFVIAADENNEQQPEIGDTSSVSCPEFYGTSEITLNVGDPLNLQLSTFRMFAKDRIDGDLTGQIETIENNVDMSNIGDYQVKYKVTNSKEESREITVPVHVTESRN